ncbi:unnamed protein product, partial [Staurois parvus]
QKTICKEYSSLPCQLLHRTGDPALSICRAIQSSVLTVENKYTAHIVKQHTVNPLIAPDVNPFLPSAISTVSVLFISTDHCIDVTGDVSDTKPVPPVSECPSQSHYKSP